VDTAEGGLLNVWGVSNEVVVLSSFEVLESDELL